MIQGKKIVVTGGAGFIGSNLITKLKLDNDIIVVDNYISGSSKNHVNGPTYLYGQSQQVNELPLFEKCDLFFHFGEYSRVEQSFNEAYQVLENNSAISNVLNYCDRSGAKLIYSCSSTVLNDMESDQSLSPYTLTKTINRKIIKNFCNWKNIDHSIVYFYNAYGRNEISTGPYATVIAKFLELKQNGATSVPVHAPGTQTRNFTYIDDIISGILLAAELGQGDGYGIGSDQSYSILQLCKLMDLKPEVVKSKMGNRPNSPLKNQEIKDLGWQESHNLERYLKELGKK